MPTKQSTQPLPAPPPEPALRVGARGFLVQRLQRALGIPADGIYGPVTGDHVAAHRIATTPLPLPIYPSIVRDTHADAALHRALHLPWPSEFLRVVATVGVLEGTGFGGCNDRDIDGAGFTMGLIGLTTRHGEVQRILAQFLTDDPTHLNDLNDDPPVRAALEYLINRHPTATQSPSSFNLHPSSLPSRWETVLFDHNRRTRASIARALDAWGQLDTMQSLQLRHARQHYWLPALRSAARLGLTSTRARALMLDIHIQNGGLRLQHLLRLGLDPKQYPPITWRGLPARVIPSPQTQPPTLANTTNTDTSNPIITTNTTTPEYTDPDTLAAIETHLLAAARKRTAPAPDDQLLPRIAAAVASAARPRWRRDVLARKTLFARGHGPVHGIHLNLRAQGIEP